MSEEPKNPPGYPSDPFYYSRTMYHPIYNPNGEYAFLYSLERRKLTDAYWDNTGSPHVMDVTDPIVLQDGVFVAPTDGESSTTFAGHGLLAFVGGGPGEIEINVSADIGQSWRRVTLPLADDSSSYYGTSLSFMSPSEGRLAAFYNNRDYNNRDGDSFQVTFFLTEDGGETWRQTGVYSEAGTYLQDIFFVTSQHFYMVSSQHAIQETFDGGLTWQPCRMDFPPYFNPSYFDGNNPSMFLRSEQGPYCAFNVERGEADDLHTATVALMPHEENGATAWEVDGPWEFDGATDPGDFFDYLHTYEFKPGYHGVEYSSGTDDTNDDEGGSISAPLLYQIYAYALEHKPESITETTGAIGDSGNPGKLHVVPRKLVADMLALIYNATDLDVTVLEGYRADVDGFTIPVGGYGKGSIGFDNVFHHVSTLANGDIAVIRDVQRTGDWGVDSRKDGARTEVQRCVFRPVVTASGVQLFTLIACEVLEDYPGAAR